VRFIGSILKIITEKIFLSTKKILDNPQLSGKLLIMKNKWPEILRKEMADRNLTQRELSTLIGTNIFTLNRWVNGRRIPSPVWQIHLRRMLKTEIA